jgi:hypothetical protein
VMAWGTLRIGEASGLRRSDVNFETPLCQPPVRQIELLIQ